MHLGIAHHLGWAVAVTASDNHEVADRRRIELIEPGVPAAPIHHDGSALPMHRQGDRLDDEALAALVARVRGSAHRATSAALDELTRTLHAPIASMSIRAWPDDFPIDIAHQRRMPYESRADSVMYLQVLAELGRTRGWSIHFYDAKTVESEAEQVLGDRAEEVLHGPRTVLGPPWSKDHRTALAATVAMGIR